MQVLEGARNQGVARIIGIDKNERKREMGKDFGMTDFINPSKSNKPISELVCELTGGEGVDYSFECSGIQSLINEVLQPTKVVRLRICINVNHVISLHIKLKLPHLYKLFVFVLNDFIEIREKEC